MELYFGFKVCALSDFQVTLPYQLRDLTWRNQKLVYTLFFFCVQNILKTFTQNDKKLKGMAGFAAILHTHSREIGRASCRERVLRLV